MRKNSRERKKVFKQPHYIVLRKQHVVRKIIEPESLPNEHPLDNPKQYLPDHIKIYSRLLHGGNYCDRPREWLENAYEGLADWQKQSKPKKPKEKEK